MAECMLIAVGAALVNNVVLSQFLGLCPFLGVSKKTDTAAGMGAAVIFVIMIASAVTYGVYYAILTPLNLEYLQTIVFILVIAALVQLVEMILKKFIKPLYEALGVYLPLITTIRTQQYSKAFPGNTYCSCFSRINGYSIYRFYRSYLRR